MADNSKRIKDAKDRWRLDTIVLDAGHGGKDPGAIGKYGTMEKDVVLDITKRIGRMLEKKTGIKVVYTRTEDIFIPLWKRTQIANESGGKLFMSIHVNASTNRKIKGFETFLHSWDKTGTAIDVAARENAVIKFEEKKVNYEKLSMERKITATMASSMFLKESEVLAASIQEELDKLREICIKHDLFLISDEVYREFFYSGDFAPSVMELKGIEDKAIMLDSASKRYSMCGVRIGAIISKNKEVIQTALKFGQARLSPPLFGQVAVEAALKAPDSYYAEVKREYENRKDVLINELSKIPDIKYSHPYGAFYTVVELPIDDDEKFCSWILTDFHYPVSYTHLTLPTILLV